MADIKNNLSATTAPSAANDASQGYATGSTWFHKEAGVMWICTDASPNEARWIVQTVDHPWPSQHIRTMPGVFVNPASGAAVPDLLTLTPFVFYQRRRIDGIGIRLVTAQANGEVRLGIYRTDPLSEKPGACLYDAGAISLAAGSGNKTIDVDWSLDPGAYWLAAIFQSVGTLPTIMRTGGTLPGMLTRASSDDVTSSNGTRCLTAAQAYGALPATAPDMSYGAGGNDAPVIFLRRA